MGMSSNAIQEPKQDSIQKRMGENCELSNGRLDSIKESTKKVAHLARIKYTGNIILNMNDGVLKSVEYKVREEIKV